MGLNKPVKFSIAKLLKEKGFGNISPTKLNRNYYNHKGQLNGDVTDYIKAFISNKEDIKLEPLKTIDAPSIIDVVTWLYENHGIWIVSSYELNIENHEKEWFWIAIKDGEEIGYQYKDFNSPTEAYEAGIEYTLNNLI